MKAQPGLEAGQEAYCPVSGVVFKVGARSGRRAVNGKALYFCCESCAGYFTGHQAAVIARRKLAL